MALEQRLEAVLKPEYAESHNNLGNALGNRGRLEAAMTEYRRALALKPDCAEAHTATSAMR